MGWDLDVADAGFGLGFLDDGCVGVGPGDGTGDVEDAGFELALLVPLDCDVLAAQFGEFSEPGGAPGGDEHHEAVPLG